MTDHNLFYCPCASFTNEQLPLLKVTALYFDKLIILDPVGASWAGRRSARNMVDREFLELCDVRTKTTGKHRWPLSLTKVQPQLQTDQAMRLL